MTPARPEEETAEAPILYQPPSPLAVWHRAIVWGIFVVALLARAAFLKQLMGTPGWPSLPADDLRYLEWARAIASGAAGPAGAFEQAPLYAWLLAGILKIAGGSLMAARLIQAVLGALTCVYVYRIGRLILSPAAGLAAGLGACALAPWLQRDAAIAPGATAALLAAATLHQLFAANASQRGLLATAGLTLGLSALASEPMLGAAIPLAVWLAIDAWVRGGRSAGRLRESAGRLVAFGSGLLLALLPAALRNFHASGGFVVIATGGAAAPAAAWPDTIPILRLLGPASAMLAPLAAAGLVLSLPRWRETLGLLFLIAGYALSAFTGLPGPTREFPALAGIALLGAACVEGVRAAAARRWLLLAAALAAAILCLLASGRLPA